MDDVYVLRIDVEVLRQHGLGLIGHDAGRANTVDVHNAGELTEPASAKLGQYKVCVILHIHAAYDSNGRAQWL